jgi:hypothetical protein
MIASVVGPRASEPSRPGVRSRTQQPQPDLLTCQKHCHPSIQRLLNLTVPPFQMPQNGVVADWHAETFHQPFSRPATSAVAEKMNKFSDPLGSTSVRTNNFWRLIRKCLTLALPVQTSPTAHPHLHLHLHLHLHGGALHREVLKMTKVSAVPTCRRRPAPGTGAYFRSYD